MRKGVHIFFSGMVQGVGFRFTARILANRHRITGWVKNLSDGRVELLGEGESGSLNDFLKDLKKEFEKHITGCELEEIPFRGELKSFELKF